MRFALAIALLSVARLETPAALPDEPVHVWQRWEHTLISSRTYSNAYAEVALRVTYAGPGQRRIHAYGFWDGGETLRIRCAFPVQGTWTWQTECSDSSNAGLHAQRGSVQVVPYAGTNVLYQHGFLKVSDNHRYVTFADASPFLWVGDTAWAAPHRSSPEEWEEYLSDRANKHFTVIQVGPAPEWAGERDRQGHKPFTDRSCAQWNPAYWQSFQGKIQRANERGFVVMLVGLMEPVYRYPESGKACLFARNIIARLFGNFGVFSPSFDSEVLPLANEVGRAARDATAVHLLTQHPGTPWNQPTPTFSDKYYDEPYLDFVGVQTGHNGGHLDWCAHHAIEWNLHLYRHEPHKPVVNLEAMYDAQGTNDWRAVDARSLAWRTFLSGAIGYTYGAGDMPPKVPQGNGAIWRWVTDPEKYDYWQKALQWDSAVQMKHLHDFLGRLEWWRLEPAHNLIRNQPDDIIRRMVLAKTATGDLGVAYLPHNDAIELDTSGFLSPLRARWFDPVRGRYISVSGTLENKASIRLSTPDDGDWVLLLEGGAIEPKRAFPTAEGFGAAAVGGRGGRVIEVTSLEDAGEGSLRTAMETSGPRICVFRVSGSITLKSAIQVRTPYLTVAGQTSPGGIEIKGNGAPKGDWGVWFVNGAHDIVVRHLRVRMGGNMKHDAGNNLLCYGTAEPGVHDVIFDHCSVSWGSDTQLDWYGSYLDRATFQWNIIGECFMGQHIGGNQAPKNITLHHNLYANLGSRTPLMQHASVFDFRNNVIYNWGGNNASVFGQFALNTCAFGNVVNNLWLAGPESGCPYLNVGNGGPVRIDGSPARDGGTRLYLAGNLGPNSPAGSTNDWTGHGVNTWDYYEMNHDGSTHLVSQAQYETKEPFPAPPVDLDPVSNLLTKVLATAGAFKPVRDAIDQRIIKSVRDKTGSSRVSTSGPWPDLALGAPAPPADSDHDGMPDDWEQAHGLDPNNPRDGATIARNGYSNVENYLNELAGDSVP